MGDPVAVPAPADNTQTTSILASLATEQTPPSPSPAPQQQEPAKAPAPTPTGTWRDRLPDDLKGHESLSKFDTEEGLAKSYVNLERLLGGDKVPVPKDPEDKEAWDRFYTAAGRPANADDYKYEPPKDLPEGISYDESKLSYVKQVAHQNGWNQRQFDNAMKALVEDQIKAHAAWKKSQADEQADFERALQLTGNAQEIKTLAATTIQQYLSQDSIALLERAGIANSPILVRDLAKIGKDLTGHSVLKGRGGEPVKTVDQIKNDISEFRKTHDSVLMNKQHPDYDSRVRELQAMYQRAYPENAA